MATTGTNKNAWDEKELGCLWRREKQATKEKYLTGVLDAEKLRKLLTASKEDIQVIVFTNKRKQKDTHPDLRIYLSEKKPATVKTTVPAPTPTVAETPAPTPDANELI